MLDEVKLSGLLSRIDSMLTIQRAQYDRIAAEVPTVATYSPRGMALSVRQNVLRDEIAMLADVQQSLRGAGVMTDQEAASGRPGSVRAASAHYGVSGEEVAVIHELLTTERAAPKRRDGCEYQAGQYVCKLRKDHPKTWSHQLIDPFTPEGAAILAELDAP